MLAVGAHPGVTAAAADATGNNRRTTTNVTNDRMRANTVPEGVSSR
jgi:hypothetical protein